MRHITRDNSIEKPDSTKEAKLVFGKKIYLKKRDSSSNPKAKPNNPEYTDQIWGRINSLSPDLTKVKEIDRMKRVSSQLEKPTTRIDKGERSRS